MGGLAVLALLGFYIFLAIKVFKAAKTTKSKAIALLLILLIPTADAIYGRIKLQQMCKAEGGLKVYRVANGVEGFMYDYADEAWIKKYGYKFLELGHSPKEIWALTDKEYDRLSEQNGEIVREGNIAPKSKYRIRVIRSYEMPDYDKNQAYTKGQEIVENIADGEKLATFTHLTFTGGWAERLVATFSDAGAGNVAWCSSEPFLNSPYLDSVEQLIASSLKP